MQVQFLYILTYIWYCLSLTVTLVGGVTLCCLTLHKLRSQEILCLKCIFVCLNWSKTVCCWNSSKLHFLLGLLMESGLDCSAVEPRPCIQVKKKTALLAVVAMISSRWRWSFEDLWKGPKDKMLSFLFSINNTLVKSWSLFLMLESGLYRTLCG